MGLHYSQSIFFLSCLQAILLGLTRLDCYFSLKQAAFESQYVAGTLLMDGLLFLNTAREIKNRIVR